MYIYNINNFAEYQNRLRRSSSFLQFALHQVLQHILCSEVRGSVE